MHNNMLHPKEGITSRKETGLEQSHFIHRSRNEMAAAYEQQGLHARQRRNTSVTHLFTKTFIPKQQGEQLWLQRQVDKRGLTAVRQRYYPAPSSWKKAKTAIYSP